MFNFSENSLEAMADKLEIDSSEFARRVRLLDDCIKKLPDYRNSD